MCIITTGETVQETHYFQNTPTVSSEQTSWSSWSHAKYGTDKAVPIRATASLISRECSPDWQHVWVFMARPPQHARITSGGPSNDTRVVCVHMWAFSHGRCIIYVLSIKLLCSEPDGCNSCSYRAMHNVERHAHTHVHTGEAGGYQCTHAYTHTVHAYTHTHTHTPRVPLGIFNSNRCLVATHVYSTLPDVDIHLVCSMDLNVIHEEFLSLLTP